MRDVQTKQPLSERVHYEFSPHAYWVMGSDAAGVHAVWGPDTSLVLGPKITYQIKVDAPGYELMHYEFNPLEKDGLWCLPEKSRIYMPTKQLELQVTIQK